MADVILSTAGKAVGEYIGGSTFGVSNATWGWFAGSLLASAMTKGPSGQGARLGDLRVNGTEPGQAFPWVAGQPRIAGQLAWASIRREIPNTESTGKGSSGKFTNYTYEVDLLVILTENPIAGISRIWLNNEMVWNGAETRAGVWNGISIYTGAQDQMPDPTYEAGVGVGNAPANRGRGSVVFTGLQLGASGQIPLLQFEIVGANGTVTEFYTTTRALPDKDYAAPGPAQRKGVSFFGGKLMLSYGSWVEPGTLNAPYGAINFSNVEPGYVNFGTIYTGYLNLTAAGTSYAGPTLAQQGPNDIQTEAILYYPDLKYQRLERPAASGYDNHYFIEEGETIFWINYNVGTNASRLDLYGKVEYDNTYQPPTFVHSHLPVAPFVSQVLPGINLQVIVTTDGYLYAMGGPSSGSPTANIYRISKTGGTIHDTISLVDDYGAVGSSEQRLVARWRDRKGIVVMALMVGSGNNYRFIYIGDDGTEVDMGILSVDNVSPVSELIVAGNALYCITATSPGGAKAIRFTITGGQVVDINTSLRFVCDELLDRCGYDANEYDVTALSGITKPMRALAVSQPTSTRGPLELLKSAFFYETESSEKLRFFPRELNPVATIPWDELGLSASDDGEAEPFLLSPGSELEIPAQVSLSYNNMAGDYQIGTVFSDRIESAQETTESIQMPLGMLPSEAKGVADALLFDKVASLATVPVSVSPKYAKLTPGDVFNAVDRDGRTYRLRIDKKTDDFPIFKWDCTLDDVGALTSSGITDENFTNTEDVVQDAATLWGSLDIPILQDADNESGYYVAIAPYLQSGTDRWPGATMVRAWDNVNFSQLFTTTQAAVFGSTAGTLPGWNGGNQFDEISRVTVGVRGELFSTTRAYMLSDLSANALLIGDEVLRFRFAQLTGNDPETGVNTYVLSSFLRGQLGTENEMNSHESGERVVLLDGRLRHVTTQNSQIGLTRYIKAVTFGQPLSSTEAEVFVDTGVALRPRSVANLRALADGADMQVSWQRRSRLSYRYGGTVGVSVPLGEATELYRIRVYNGTALLNTYSSTTPAWTYAAAAQSSDGVTPGATLIFEVMQMSEVVGEGFPEFVEGIAP